MPQLRRAVIRRWLAEQNWAVARLADECSAIGADTIPEGTLRNAVHGIDPIRPGRIRLICTVTAQYGAGLTYAQLVEENGRPTNLRSEGAL